MSKFGIVRIPMIHLGANHLLICDSREGPFNLLGFI